MQYNKFPLRSLSSASPYQRLHNTAAKLLFFIEIHNFYPPLSYIRPYQFISSLMLQLMLSISVEPDLYGMP